MGIRATVIQAIKCIKMEYKLIDKMLTALENQDEEQFNLIQETYKLKKAKTDYVIGTLLQDFSLDEILASVTSFMGPSFEGYINAEGLGEIIINDFFSARHRMIFDKPTSSHSEEHIKYLLSTYLWDQKNSELTEEQKKGVHRLVLPFFAKSEFVRSYFAGDVETAEICSTPDESFGKLYSDRYALPKYYKLLNNLIKECNITEYFEGLDSEDNCCARRKFVELQLAALSIQMDRRELVYPTLECPISDFAEDRIRNASELVKRINNNETKQMKKVIRL